MKRPVLILLILETLVAIPIVPMSAWAALYAPMIFDDRGSTGNRLLRVGYWSVVSFPFVAVAAILVAWILFALRRDRAALWISLLPVITGFTAAIALDVAL